MADWGYDDVSGSFIDLPEWDYGSDVPTFSPDIWSLGSNYYADAYDPWSDASWIGGYLSPEVTGYNPVQALIPASPVPQPPAATPTSTLASAPWFNALAGAAGPFASLLGVLASGGVTGTNMPKLPTAAKAQIDQASRTLEPLALGQTALQQQQASMLAALAQGQIPQGYIDLVARAYDPAYQAVAQRATEASRQAGFYDAPLSAPPGGAIVGPAAAALQGQQANSLLGLMQTLPALYNQPIQTQVNAATNQSGNLLRAAGLQTGGQTSQPLGPAIGQGIGGLISGAAQGYSNAVNAQQQQTYQTSLLDALRNLSPQTSLSQAPSQQPYDFSQTYA